MNKSFKELLTLILGLIAVSVFLGIFHGTTSAAPACGKVFEVDADEDNDPNVTLTETGGKVEITFNDTDGTAPSDDDRNQVVVTAGPGYEIINVQYELEHYSGIGWTTVPGSNPTTTITLAGIDDDSRIDEVEVKLQEVACVTPTVTDTPTPTPTTPPTNGGNGGDGGNGGVGGPGAAGPQPAVLGLATTSGDNSLVQILPAFVVLLTGAYLLRKNA
ncbi:MAG: hypothetical protein HY427_00160 [Candidatus Levybacteria bacterium]|nr:hypothetical protein [Candidatus Levybacteria bacterium]